jgi:peptidoglycan/LPS O-acetylase OafA/YrhL
MITWGTIVYGAVLTTVIAAAVLVLVVRERRPEALSAGLAATLLGPLAWNAILHRTGGRSFFVDIPFKPFPVSWQDTGSGVFTLAVAAVLLGIGLRREPAGRVLQLAVIVALAAFLVDIYLY